MHVRLVDERATRELRRAVLRPHLSAGDPLPGDELDPSRVLHVAAVDDHGVVVSTCFVYPEACPWRPDLAPAWHLRQMATAPEVRGQGFGTAVLAEALEEVRRRGARLLWFNARRTAASFYARAGFRQHGGVFTDEQHPIPHVRMWLELEPDATSSR